MERVHVIDTGSATGRVNLTGRLDALGAPELYALLSQDISEGCRHLVIDLSGLEFIDSAGLAVMVRVRRDLQAVDGDLVLVRPRSPEAMRVFRLTQFDRIFTMVDAPPEAGAR